MLDRIVLGQMQDPSPMLKEPASPLKMSTSPKFHNNMLESPRFTLETKVVKKPRIQKAQPLPKKSTRDRNNSCVIIPNSLHINKQVMFESR
jgi:hypothetical protein